MHVSFGAQARRGIVCSRVVEVGAVVKLGGGHWGAYGVAGGHSS